jgi:hypothetical protein
MNGLLAESAGKGGRRRIAPGLPGLTRMTPRSTLFAKRLDKHRDLTCVNVAEKSAGD